MEYITVKEAAKRWGISERLVQKYCAQGRIKEVRRFGKVYGIPNDTSKPVRLNKKDIKTYSANQNESNILFPLLNSFFDPGKCLEYINDLPDEKIKDIAKTEYYYFSGQAKKAIEIAELYLNDNNLTIRLTAMVIYFYANIGIEQTENSLQTIRNIKKIILEDSMIDSPQKKAAIWFVVYAATVLLHLPLPEYLPKTEEWIPHLSGGLKSFALYVKAHRAYLQKEYDKSLGIIETALCMQERVYPIPTIYLHLAAVMDYMSLRKQEEARRHLLAAWELSYQDNLIEGYAEHHGLLGGMLEVVIKKDWPEDFKRIIAITYHFSAGWIEIHNLVTGRSVTNNLTTTEFVVAMLAARGWTNSDIGKHLHISANTVKHHVSGIMQKLGINKRKDLYRYLIQ